jgi:hypothetical protein
LILETDPRLQKALEAKKGIANKGIESPAKKIYTF